MLPVQLLSVGDICVTTGTDLSAAQELKHQAGMGDTVGANYLHLFFFLSIWEQPHPHSLSLLPVIQVQISQLPKESIVWKCWECCWV